MELFEDKYTIVEGLSAYQDEDGSHLLETHGEDLENVLKIAKSNPRKVWTLVDADNVDSLVAVAGYHICNRVHYVITVEEWKDENEEYIY